MMISEKNNALSGYSVALNGYARVLFTKLFRTLQKNNADENYPKVLFLV